MFLDVIGGGLTKNMPGLNRKIALKIWPIAPDLFYIGFRTWTWASSAPK
jgi:hypothetical protein